MLCETNSNVLIFTSQYNNRNSNHHNRETINYIKNNDNNADNVTDTAIHRDNNGPSTITNNSDVIANDDDDRDVWSDHGVHISEQGGKPGR